MSMHLSKITKTTFTIIALLAGAFLSTDFTFAATESSCLSSSPDRNVTSIKNACSLCFSDPNHVMHGALWINGTSSAAGDKVHVDDDDIAAGKVTIYLHGAVYTCSQSAGLDATHVHLTKSAVGAGGSPTGKEVSYISGYSGRSVNRSSGVSGQYDWSNVGSISATLDIKKFMNAAGCPDDAKTCSATVHVFRCPSGYNYPSSSCYSDPSTITLTTEGGSLIKDPVTCPVDGFTDYGMTATDKQGKTDGVSGVKKTSSSKYDKGVILLKPGDTFEFAHCYSPGAAAVKKSSGSHEEPKPAGDGPIKTVDNTVGNQDTYVDQTNAFRIISENISISGIPGVNPAFKNNGPGFSPLGATNSASFTSEKGDTTSAVVVTNNKLKVQVKHAHQYGYQYISSNYWGTNAVTGHTTWHWTYLYDTTCIEILTGTPYPCVLPGYGTGTHNQPWYKVTQKTGYDESNRAGVYIPYNYNADIRVTPKTDTTPGIVFPGQKYSTAAEVHITPRENTRTDGTYATETPEIEARLVTFYLYPGTSGEGKVGGSTSTSSDPCSYYEGIFGGSLHHCSRPPKNSIITKWNSTGNMDGSVDPTLNTNFAVEDMEAGTIFCVAAGIHSASSGDDTGNGITDYNWAISPATCYTVAKKPSLHVYGGSTFTNGSVKTAITEKFNTSKSKAFGSLDEFAITGSKSIITTTTGMASGNTFNNSGYSTAASTMEDPDVLCGLSPLSIANYKCKSGRVGYSNIALDNTMVNRLMARFTLTSAEDGKSKNLSNINLATDFTLSDNTVRAYRYVFLDGASTIKAAPVVGNGVNYIIYARGDVTIDTNITYADSDDYTSVADIPQVVIIVPNGNVKISQNVTQLDAWIIAPDGTINTCYEYKTNGGTNDASKNENELVNINNHCNQPLTINGPVVAKNLILNRTAGAGAGNNSSKPAEAINLTADTYIWAYAQARDYPQAFTTYLRELAPRY